MDAIIQMGRIFGIVEEKDGNEGACDSVTDESFTVR